MRSDHAKWIEPRPCVLTPDFSRMWCTDIIHVRFGKADILTMMSRSIKTPGEFAGGLFVSEANRDQRARAAAFRFLRQPSRPSAPRPPANSGRAAGSGVAIGVAGGSNATPSKPGLTPQLKQPGPL